MITDKEFKKVVNYLKDEKGLRCWDVFEGEADFKDDTYRYQLVSPHGGTNFKFMLRKGEINDFDRWANSTDEEIFFKNLEELKKILAA